MKSLSNNKNAGLQLSVNFLVMFILGIIMFALGMAFLYQIVFGIDPIKKGLDERTKVEIRNILSNTNQLVVLPYYKIDIKRGKGNILGVGIRNNLTSSSEANFQLLINCEKAFKNNVNFEPICVDCAIHSCNLNWVVYHESKTIGRHKYDVIEVPIVVPKDVESGLYIFKLRATALGVSYGSERTFIVNVI
jgi:hypothetical protein